MILNFPNGPVSLARGVRVIAGRRHESTAGSFASRDSAVHVIGGRLVRQRRRLTDRVHWEEVPASRTTSRKLNIQSKDKGSARPIPSPRDPHSPFPSGTPFPNPRGRTAPRESTAHKKSRAARAHLSKRTTLTATASAAARKPALQPHIRAGPESYYRTRRKISRALSGIARRGCRMME